MNTVIKTPTLSVLDRIGSNSSLNKRTMCTNLLISVVTRGALGVAVVNLVLMCALFTFWPLEGASRKGRTKKEANSNTNRHSPAGHERKIVEKLQNAEKKAKE